MCACANARAFTILENSSKVRQFGKKDILFLTALFLFGLVLTGFIYLSGSSGSQLRVMLDGELYGVYALDEEQQIEIWQDGTLLNSITIVNGAAYMDQANCPDGLCKKQGKISQTHQTIVCLPHKLVAEIDGAEESGYDTISE